MEQTFRHPEEGRTEGWEERQAQEEGGKRTKFLCGIEPGTGSKIWVKFPWPQELEASWGRKTYTKLLKMQCAKAYASGTHQVFWTPQGGSWMLVRPCYRSQDTGPRRSGDEIAWVERLAIWVAMRSPRGPQDSPCLHLKGLDQAHVYFV